ncbi:hypothetical protein [Olsenella sp. An188]|uniref:hypothetical protein n=1 Tax=Olsenella sp. An188 TaxID=1965579 RepID=UPI000B3A9CD4|nr:hypothetical protein [Olsenella sp. An188]OUP39836.1 hypothetical protein B5F23_02330 [Olsenella sp. An188]
MRRSPRLAVAVLLATVAVVAALCAGALARSGWGPALQSVLDRVLPIPSVQMWASAPEPDSFDGSYADATGAGENYVYRVRAAAADGTVRELTLISFGARSGGEGWLRIEARGGSAVHYWPADAAEVPDAAVAALAP